MKNMLDKATITEKVNQLLAELRANPDWIIDKKNQTRLFESTGMGIIRYRNKTKITEKFQSKNIQ
jgi:hypothetical protein